MEEISLEDAAELIAEQMEENEELTAEQYAAILNIIDPEFSASVIDEEIIEIAGEE